MTLKTFIIQAEDTAVAALKEVGTIVEGVVLTITQQLVAKVKDSDIGTMAMNVISLLESHDKSGAEKFTDLVAIVTPAIEKLHAAGGLPGLETSLLGFTHEFADSAVNDFKAALPKVAAVTVQAVNDVTAEAVAA